MLLVDQLEKLNETMAQILDVKRYDVGYSFHRQVTHTLTSSRPSSIRLWVTLMIRSLTVRVKMRNDCVRWGGAGLCACLWHSHAICTLHNCLVLHGFWGGGRRVPSAHRIDTASSGRRPRDA